MFDQVGEGVFRRRYPSLDLNIGVVFGDDGVLLVDTRATGAQATELREELGSSTDLPVRWVVNTHWHWDHTFGNARFRGCRIWGHELCRVALEDRSEEMRREAKDALGAEFDADIDATEIQPPTEVFSDSISIDIGRIVELSYHGLAHTDSDIVVGVPDAGVVFLGDLVEEGAPPAFGDSYPISWPLTLRLAMDQDAVAIVPGHGDIVDRDFVVSQHEELVAVAELAARFVEGEVEMEEAMGRGPYPRSVMSTALLRARATAG